MRYRGFELKPTERRFPHAIVVRGIGVFCGGECLAYAADQNLVKRLIDERIRSGIWKDEAQGEAAGGIEKAIG